MRALGQLAGHYCEKSRQQGNQCHIIRHSCLVPTEPSRLPIVYSSASFFHLRMTISNIFHFCQTYDTPHQYFSFSIKDATFHLSDKRETFIQKVPQFYTIKSIQMPSISSSFQPNRKEEYQCLLCKTYYFTFALKYLSSCPLKEISLRSIFFVKSASLYTDLLHQCLNMHQSLLLQ